MYKDVNGKDLDEQNVEDRIKEMEVKRQKLFERLPNFNSLVKSLREKTKEFTIKKLANILYQCLVCESERRDIVDWRVAEEFVQNRAGVDMIDFFTQKVLVSKAYLDGSEGAKEDFDYVLFSLGQYSNCLISDLLYNASQGYNFQSFDKYAGSTVWT